ncbi:hypothetical protein [Nibricoccus sp. IMCC34717]|uniref:hypothetical protein n=1 Tax=Nibricoccus sp. IMCC34717 TaxID=3034021 RepID=UPI00384EE56F
MQVAADMRDATVAGALPRPTQAFWGFVADGALFTAATAFVADETVVPQVARSLASPNWIIALLPMLLLLGYSTGVFGAGLFEVLPRVRPLLLLLCGVQRLGYLGAGLVLILKPEGHLDTLALGLVVGAPILSGMLGGFSLGGYMRLMDATVPRSLALRQGVWKSVVGCLLGVGSGLVVHEVIDRWPGHLGFGLLYLLAFLTYALSWVALRTVQEPAQSAPSARHESLSAFLMTLPGLLRADGKLRRASEARLFSGAMYIAIPFLGLEAVRLSKSGSAIVGFLVAAQVLGALVGSLTLALLESRMGASRLLFAGTALVSVVLLSPLVHGSVAAIVVAFFGYGCGRQMITISQSALGWQLAPRERVSTYYTLLTAVDFPALLGVFAVSFALQSQQVPFAAILVVASAGMAISAVLAWTIRVPSFSHEVR